MSGTTSTIVSTIVRAGAGAGKTTRLIGTIVNYTKEYQQANGRYPKIIVCTFTRKATQELKERLMREAIALNDWSFVRFVNSPALHISTIHGVLLKFLSVYGYRLGLDPQFRFIDRYANLKNAKKLIRDLMTSDELDVTERELISEAFNINDLAEFGMKYYEVSSLVPDLKFSDEESFREIFNSEAQREIAAQKDFLRELKSLTGKKPALVDVTQWVDDAEKVFIQVLAESSPERFLIHFEEFPSFRISKDAEPYEAKLGEVRNYYNELKNKWTGPEHNSVHWRRFVAVHAALEGLFQKFSERFKEQKTSTGELQIADLEVLALELIRKFPDTSNLFSTEWDYWLVDEYQDTSPIQVELIKNLQGLRCGFTVGDPQQSIYLFRGARCEVFSAKENELKQSGGTLEKLDVNYRSRPALVNFFNYIFKSSRGEFFPMRPGKPETEVSQSDVELLLHESREDKIKAVVAAVYKLIAAGAQPDGICVLARTNEKLKRVARGLSDLNISCLLHASGGFYDRREILDALALLKFILNPHDNINFIELLRSPWFYVEDQKILSLFSGNEEVSYWSHIIKNRIHEAEPMLLKLSNILNQRESQGLVALFKGALVSFGFFDYSHHLDVTGRREANLWKLIIELEEALRSPGFNYIGFVRDAINAFDLEAESDQDAVSARESNRVNLMTVHKSKGLEFEHVIVMDVDEDPVRGGQRPRWLFDEDSKLFSGSLYSEEDSRNIHSLTGIKISESKKKLELAESQRVFYVAVTRAMKTIVLVGSPEPHKESWQSLWKLNLIDGNFDGPGFKYRVSRQIDDVVLNVSSTEKNKSIRPLLKLAASAEENFYSVSQMVGQRNQTSKVPGRERNLLDRVHSVSRGILMHRIFEAMKYKVGAGRDTLIQRFFPHGDGETEQALKWVRNLNQPPIAELLKVGHVEWGFIYRDNDGSTIEGQIDLWGQIAQNVWIIDYKTGSSNYAEKAFDQMRWYAKAIRAKGVVGKITMAALYPFEEKVELADFDG